MKIVRAFLAAALFVASGITMTGKIQTAEADVNGCTYASQFYGPNSEVCQGGTLYICENPIGSQSQYIYQWAPVEPPKSC